MLRRLPAYPLAGRRLFRIHGRRHLAPWWFASAPRESSIGGRFDLAEPYGSCYLATSVGASTLEALQGLLGDGLVLRSVLDRLLVSTVTASPTAPPAARLTAAACSGIGITEELWAASDRRLTKSWAGALHRAWDGIYTGVAHDPTGRSRAVTLFDYAGEHAPFGDDRWTFTSRPASAEPGIAATLRRHGVEVVVPGDLEVVAFEETP